jgi:Protein of unknown function (DUF3987)
MKPSESEIRSKFFELIFEDQEGYLCIATTEKVSPRQSFKQRFFEWPTDWREIEAHILKNQQTRNVYFCVSLLKKKERKKENCQPTSLLWADMDVVNPDTLSDFIPPITVESSDGRWQAYWRMSTKVPPLQAEEYSRRLAYNTGADTSGWDLTQLLRVPMTYNFKHEPAQLVRLHHASSVKAPPLLFEKLLPPTLPVDIAIPADDELPSLEQILYKYGRDLKQTAFEAVYTQDLENTTEADWSKMLWRLHHICLSVGMSVEETFVVARSAPCNKYARDGRPEEHLWQEIIKAEASRTDMNLPDSWDALKMPHLVDGPVSETFIDEYTDWAIDATDAVEEYHRLSAFMVLSSIISTSVRLPTSYDSAMVPNLWGMILGDSTLSRKTTAMGMARNLILMTDPENIVATDGTPEGLLSALEQRPGKSSVFYVDEVSGFFNSINRKDYQAGMRETLTALYDSPPVLSRRLRKESITINSPLFILFCGGITDHVYEAVNEDYVISGFLPRFLVVTGEADENRIRDTHRPHEPTINKYVKIKARVADLYELYAVDVPTKIGNQTVMQSPRIMADLDDKAWIAYGNIERTMRNTASDYTPNRAISLPTFERLSRSILKMSVLLGCDRQQPVSKNGISTVSINTDDVMNAAWYVQRWGEYSIELIMHAGTGRQEKLLERIIVLISENPGILRGRIMTRFRLYKREADDILGTLEDRGLVRREKVGKGSAYWIA